MCKPGLTTYNKREEAGGDVSAVHEEVNNHNGGHQQNNNGTMPLFYAMEKQAELTQAPNEIARLAGLLGDAESSKQEAIDNVEDFRLEMELVTKLVSPSS